MSLILFIHLIAIGVWAGCIATEIVCEVDQKHVNFKDSYIAPLHWSIDRFVELPAILIASITGYLMLQGAVFTTLLLIKVSAGILAVIFNLIAAYTVFQRYNAFKINNEQDYQKYHLLHERVGVGCVLFVLVAIVSGGLHFAS